MRIEIINTGSELMLGRVLNTHQQWLCRQLADLGYPTQRQVAVDDSGPAICEAVREALGRANWIITTGGLGPTSDDRTRDLIAGLLGRPLREDPEVLAHIVRMFQMRQRPMPQSTKVQALVPEGAIVLMNANGTAPGLVLESGRRDGRPQWLVMLPGPPRELRPMFTQQVVPLLREHFPLEEEFACRTLRTTGLGESRVEELIAAPLKPLTDAGLDLGYCARIGEVDVRFVKRGQGAAEMAAVAERIVRGLIGERIFGVEDDLLEQVVVHRLTELRQTLAVAESCTGGLLAHRLTNVPGASAVLWGGFVTYANEAKQQWLGVRAETLATYGAVSEPTAREMAEGVRATSGANYALSVTGIAGPGGGSETKPVGTVFIGLASKRGTQVRRFANAFDRETFKYVTTQQALDWLRMVLAEEG